jgi:hypothetical protein
VHRKVRQLPTNDFPCVNCGPILGPDKCGHVVDRSN